MAEKISRINVEASLFTQRAWFELVIKTKSADTALGALVRCWLVAQKFWFPEKKPIPAEVWAKENLNNLIIECGFAEIRDDGIYVRGSSEQFSWLFGKSEGGKASAEARKRRNGSAQPGKKPRKSPKSSKKLEQSSNAVQALFDVSSNSPEAPTPTPTPTPSPVPVPSPSSDFGKSSEPCGPPPETNKTQFLIATYCDQFRQRWGMNPEILPKHAGIARRLAEPFSKAKIERLLEGYFQLPDADLFRNRHPLESIEYKINQIVVFIESGKFTTRLQARQADEAATTNLLLANIERKIQKARVS